jgi:hypothetical protein
MSMMVMEDRSLPISTVTRVRNLILHPGDWSVCTEPDIAQCRYAGHEISPNLVSYLEEDSMTNTGDIVVKRKKPKDQSGVITPKDLVPQVVLNMPSESRSSVDIKQTAKGDSQVEIKVYAGTSVEDMERLADLAVKTYRRTCKRLQATKEDTNA